MPLRGIRIFPSFQLFLFRYIVSGGMQDWNYLNTNCFEVTVEMNCEKFPQTKKLRYLWEENKYALLKFIDLIHG